MNEQIEEQEYLSLSEATQAIGWTRATVEIWVKELGIEKHTFLRNKKTYLKACDVAQLKEIKEKPWKAGEKKETPSESSEPSERIITERIIQVMKRLVSKGNTTPSARDIAKYMHEHSEDIKPYLVSLARDGSIQSFDGRQAPRYILKE